MARYEAGIGKLFRSKIGGREVGSWKFYFRRRQISTGTKNRRQAEQFRRQFLAKQTIVAESAKFLTIADLLSLVHGDYERRRLKTIDKLESRITSIKQNIGHLQADRFRAADVAAYVDARDEDGMAPASINRELETIRRGFRLAAERELLSRVPHIRMLPEENVRETDLTAEEYMGLIAELREPVRLMTVIAYHIGWRAGRIKRLRWPQVDFEAGVIRPEANQARQKWVGPAPIYGELEKALLVARANWEKHWPTIPWVLHRAGEQLKSYRAEWERARSAIGRPDLRFHDLRHAAVTNMVEAGIDESRVMEIVGHKTQAMLRRYRIVADRHIVAAGKMLEMYLKEAMPDEQKGTVQ